MADDAVAALSSFFLGSCLSSSRAATVASGPTSRGFRQGQLGGSSSLRHVWKVAASFVVVFLKRERGE